MVKKTISELDDILDTQEHGAVCAVEQNGATFKAPVIPNPPRRLNVKTQQQLEDQFGVNIEIPNGQSWLISVDESFTLDKPIKIGLGSAMRILGGASSVTITYTGTGVMFQNTVSTDPIDSFDLRLIRIAGNFTNTAFDLIGGTNSFFFINTAQIIQFDDVGFIDMDLVEIKSLGMFAVNQGLTIKDPNATSINVVIADQTGLGDTGMTVFSFIQSVPSLVILDDIRAINKATENVVFFDPNAPAGANFVITNATKTLGSLFQPGVGKPTEALFASGDDTRFDIIAHGLVKGQTVRLQEFTGQTGYNGTFIVTDVIDVDLVDIGVGFLGSDPSGSMNAKSLDSTDVLVSAFNNPGSPSSMAQAEGTNNAMLVFNSIIGTFVPFQNTVPAPGDFIQDPITERFTIDTSTGVMTYIGTEAITNIVEFNFDISKVGGSTDNVVTSLFQNATQIPKTDKSIVISSTPTAIAVGTLLAIQPGDTFQIEMDSDSVSVIHITNWRILTRN